eukprot:scaffold16555_cov130-Isochrysis_galbana.AAC.7
MHRPRPLVRKVRRDIEDPAQSDKSVGKITCRAHPQHGARQVQGAQVSPGRMRGDVESSTDVAHHGVDITFGEEPVAYNPHAQRSGLQQPAGQQRVLPRRTLPPRPSVHKEDNRAPWGATLRVDLDATALAEGHDGAVPPSIQHRPSCEAHLAQGKDHQLVANHPCQLHRSRRPASDPIRLYALAHGAQDSTRYVRRQRARPATAASTHRRYSRHQGNESHPFPG